METCELCAGNGVERKGDLVRVCPRCHGLGHSPLPLEESAPSFHERFYRLVREIDPRFCMAVEARVIKEGGQ